MTSVLQDLKYAFRGFGRRPGHTALVVLTLAVGLGLNTVAFSSVNALLFKPFRTPHASEYGWVFAGPPNNHLGNVSRELFQALRSRASTLDTLVAEGRVSLGATSPDGAEQVWGLAVSSDYFSVVTAPTVVGRVLSRTDVADGAIPILISERYWQSRFDAADMTTVHPVLNGQLTSVIGVVADGFQGPGGIFEPHLWFPLEATHLLRLSVGPTDPWLTMMARPGAGVTPAQIATDVLTIAAGHDAAAADSPTNGPERWAQYVPIIDGHPEARSLRAAAALAMSAVGLVLLIACFNVAGLILARSAERQRELGLRSALGASRLRLTRQLLVEGLVLASLAGTAALVLAIWSERILGGLSLPAPIPQRLHFSMDWRMVAFTAALVVIAAVVPVLAPAWQVFRTDPILWLKAAAAGSGGGAAPARARRTFVLLQVVGSTAFLTLALMFVTSYVSAARIDQGFNTTHVAVMQVTPEAFALSPERQRGLVNDLVSRLSLTTDIAGVSVADRVPFDIGSGDVRQVSTTSGDCAANTCFAVATSGVTTSFFDTLELPLRAGRFFDHTAGSDANAVVINEAAAALLWPGASPLGQWVYDNSDAPPSQVVGVVADIVTFRFDRPHDPYLYRPLTADHLTGAVTIAARSRTGADLAAAALRATWRDIDHTLPQTAVQTMDGLMALPLWPARVGAAFFATCGTLAVLLVTIGLFGVTYYAVAQRTREFGIRLALGATPLDLRRLVLGESLRLIAPGLVLGTALAALGGTLARVGLVGVSPLDPRWYVTALVIQTGVALLASWSPARQAARASPQATLRSE
ncbi:MAG: ABC transporter permease [Acidobacteria bacterium]|nr:ABC transporter permease [Acidobacteriota bacterium]